MDGIINFTGGKRKIQWDPSEMDEPEKPEASLVVEAKAARPEIKKVIIQTVSHHGKKSGNGHRSQKTRSLEDTERDRIREEFIRINGSGPEDHWLIFRNVNLGSEVAIFQVTGFVSYLHREVASGRLTLNDMTTYLIWLREQYKLWAQYESPKYRTYRTMIQDLQYQTAQSPNLSGPPQFAAGFPSRRKVI